MGVSRVSFRGESFEVSDPVLEVWLRLLVDAVSALQRVPEWLMEARDGWQLQATEEFGFGMVPELDRYLTDDCRRQLLLELAIQSFQRLKSFGDPISAEVLNQIHAGKGKFPRDLPAEMFLRPACAFIALLDKPCASQAF